MVEFARPFAAIRKDPRWVRKVLLAAAVNLIPYFGAVAVTGWGLAYLRSVAWGEDETLPEWTGLGHLALQGLWAVLAVLPYSMVLSAVVTPIIFVVVVASSRAMLASGPTPGWFGLILGVSVVPSLALMYLLIPITYSVYARVALYGRLEAGFELRQIWASMRASRPTLLRAWAYTAAVSSAFLLPAFALMYGPYFPLLAAIPDMRALEGGGGAVLLASFAAMPVGFAVALVGGVVNAVAGGHYWGRHARIAYRLEEAAAQPAPGAAV